MPVVRYAFLALCIGAAFLQGQTLLTTTLTNAIGPSDNQLNLGSVTGLAIGSELFIDHEAMRVYAVNTTAKAVNVQRGVDGTTSSGHAAASTVYGGLTTLFISADPAGTCAAPAASVYVNVANATRWACASGVWTQQGGGGGGGGATIASTTNVIRGDGAGNGAAVTGTASDCVHVDGSSGACGSSTTYTGDGTISITGTEIGVNTAAIPNRAMVQSGQDLYCAGSASATAQTCSFSATLTAYTTGMRFLWRSGATNTSGGLTLSIDSVGAKAIKVSDCTTDPGASTLPSGQAYWLWYNGTNFCIASQVSVQRIFQTSTISYQGDASSTRMTMGWNSATSANGGVATNVMNYTGNAASSSTAGTLQFVDAATKCADYTWRVPANYVSGLTFSVDGYASTGGAAAVKLGTRILAIPSGTTANSGSLGTVAYTTPSLGASALRNVIPLPLDGTSVGTIAANGYVIIELCREGADAADTSAATFTMTSSEISYLASVQNY